ncbi:tyrosine-type recombinase/integrase [Gilvimarinus xylanilyticus]|uniref:Tyrosine-type recombinase/integrase n=1 Tax=Gilvimarinus xylanilyticus TaxID=2944139 RepID=A0A9X2KSM6_9GAMM|nr:site-specific integrase [Gilvimarinus xylanilyticus]MCP8898976.1 tyrosine-type recombinase/integrase [Gilvimarinus xylanilyticus]
MTKSQQPISSAQIKALRSGDKDLADTGENRGLRVHCGAGGTKSFYYRYTSPLSKKLVQLQIGHFPELSLAEARLALQDLKSQRKKGVCPAFEQKRKLALKAREERALSTSMTVKQLVDLYLTQHIEDRRVGKKVVPGARKRKGQAETRRTLYGDAVRVLGNFPAESITRRQVVNLVMDIVKRGSNVQAGNVLRELCAAYEYGIGLEKFDESFANPAFLAKNSLRQAKIKLTSNRGRRVLSDQELARFLQWLPGSVFTPTQKNVLRFTLWTACRTGEVCNARWADIDLEQGAWHLRETKTGVERYVQLPRQAIEFLKQLKLTTGEYLFPSQKTGRPIQQKTLTEQAWRLRETGRMLDIDHWSPHDLRRTVRTGLSRLGCPSEVAEAILGHSRSGIEGTYDLHGYERESRVWLQKWADRLERI